MLSLGREDDNRGGGNNDFSTGLSASSSFCSAGGRASSSSSAGGEGEGSSSSGSKKGMGAGSGGEVGTGAKGEGESTGEALKDAMVETRRDSTDSPVRSLSCCKSEAFWNILEVCP